MENSQNYMAGYSELFGRNVPREPLTHPCLDGQFDDDEDGAAANHSGIKDFPDPELGWGQLFTNTNGKEIVPTNYSVKEKGESSESGIVDEKNVWEEEDEEDSDDDYDELEFWGERNGPNSQASQAAQKNFQTSDELFRKFSSKVNVEKYEGVESLPSGAGNKILASSKRAMSQGMKVKDKQDRATVEQVLDPKTRMIVYKLLSSGKIVTIDGCISTGKEANVYHATGPDNTALAIKIFKTSILTFKARDKYVSGEYRFRNGYSKKNPRKMVRLWAEKEFRNLLRIHTSGTIKVPHPKLLKSHVLVMDFIGENGWPCPLLKDVKFSELDLDDLEQNKVNDATCSDCNMDQQEDQDPILLLITDLYRQCLIILYRLFKHCKLVHADFSEFNLILKDGKELYVIDVSQSVEHDHPRSFDFLRHDIKNVQEFFGKQILVGDYKDIFEFITSPNVDDSNYEAVLESILKKAKQLESFNVGDEVFRQTHIPRKMQEVVDYERDYEKMKHGETELVYTKVMGMKADMSGPDMTVPSLSSETTEVASNIKKVTIAEENLNNQGAAAAASNEDSDESGSESDTESDDLDEEGEKNKPGIVRPKDESLEEKRLRKKQVKEDKAEKRKNKVKKHVKKRKEKLAHANSKR